MTEKSWLWTTGTSGDGASTYTQIDTSEFMKVIAACAGFEGVAHSYLNGLAGTASTNTCTINTGGAIVDGKPYKNDASVAVNIPSSVTNNRIDRVVLRASWAAFTVRITRIPGTEAVSPTPPALTQTSGTTYDIPLYQALVTPAGAVTLTNERTLARPIIYRQGGNAADWTNSATATTFNETNYIQQVGVIAASGATIITFPTAFSNKPLVIATTSLASRIVSVTTITATTATVTVKDLSGVDAGASVYWLAIGEL